MNGDAAMLKFELASAAQKALLDDIRAGKLSPAELLNVLCACLSLFYPVAAQVTSVETSAAAGAERARKAKQDAAFDHENRISYLVAHPEEMHTATQQEKFEVWQRTGVINHD